MQNIYQISIYPNGADTPETHYFEGTFPYIRITFKDGTSSHFLISDVLNSNLLLKYLRKIFTQLLEEKELCSLQF